MSDLIFMSAPMIVNGIVAGKRKRYLSLISQGKGEKEEALALRAELDYMLAGDAVLHKADLELQKRELMKRMSEN